MQGWGESLREKCLARQGVFWYSLASSLPTGDQDFYRKIRAQNDFSNTREFQQIQH
jgi:hypothetical protein